MTDKDKRAADLEAAVWAIEDKLKEVTQGQPTVAVMLALISLVAQMALRLDKVEYAIKLIRQAVAEAQSTKGRPN